MMCALAASIGHVPFGAGHVPVEFVVVLKKAQGVADAVMQGDGARDVGSAWDIDFELELAALPAAIDAQRLAAAVLTIGGADVGQEKGIVEAAHAGIFDGNGAVDSVPCADELNLDGFGDVERRVWQDVQLHLEIADAQCARRGGRAAQCD